MLVETVGYAATLYYAKDSLSPVVPMPEFLRQKLFVAKMAGRGALHGMKVALRTKEHKSHGADAVMTAINTTHYFTDESIGLALLPAFKNALATTMPNTAAAVTAVAAETTAVTALAVGLGYANMRVREKKGRLGRDLSTAERTAFVLTAGVPFAAQAGYLRNTKEMVRQSLTTFAGQHVVLAAGVIGAAESFSPTIAYAAAGALMAKQAVESAFDYQARLMGIESLPILPTEPPLPSQNDIHIPSGILPEQA